MSTLKLKVSFSPFVHSGIGTKKWFFILTVASLPITIVLTFYNPAILFKIILSAGGFWLGINFFSFFKGKNKVLYNHYIKYVLWGIFFSVALFLSGIDFKPLPVVFAVSALSSVAMYSVSSSRREILPPFIPALILFLSLFSYESYIPALAGRYIIFLSLVVGIIFLITKKVLSLPVLLGILFSSSLSYIFTGEFRFIIPAFMTIIFSYPGFVPEDRIFRFFYALIAGTAGFFLGIPGVVGVLLFRKII